MNARIEKEIKSRVPKLEDEEIENLVIYFLEEVMDCVCELDSDNMKMILSVEYRNLYSDIRDWFLYTENI